MNASVKFIVITVLGDLVWFFADGPEPWLVIPENTTVH
mgnify:CR=1 FL=1